ncbi:hypothetical protein ACLOJK_012874 [Asimina triloba]
MAQQWEEGGWPLGLQPLNMRIGLARNREASSSMSFSTLITDTSTSPSVSSSDLDTQSTGSFFPEKSTTLGNLIGIRSIIEVSGRRRGEEESPEELKRMSCGGCRARAWFSLSRCAKLACGADKRHNNPQSTLAHFLEVERRAAGIYRPTTNPSNHPIANYRQTRLYI